MSHDPSEIMSLYVVLKKHVLVLLMLKTIVLLNISVETMIHFT